MRPHCNYRIVKIAESEFAIREVFYDERGEIVRVATVDVAPFGETTGLLFVDLDKMLRAFALPVVNMSAVEKA